jgi:hypothetical protein
VGHRTVLLNAFFGRSAAQLPTWAVRPREAFSDLSSRSVPLRAEKFVENGFAFR